MKKVCLISMMSVVGALAVLAFTTDEAHAAIPPAWCTHANTQKLAGDVNGDGLEDLVCHDKVTGYKWVALRESTGLEERWWNDTIRFCSHPSAKLYIGDVNGDRRADLVCKDPNRVWVDYGESNFYMGTNWEFGTHWCTHASTLQFFVADENLDGRADMVCRDPVAGFSWVDYADAAGRFFDTDVGRQAAELEITSILQTPTTHRITVRNNGVSANVARVECSRPGHFASRTVNLPLALGTSMTVILTALPVLSGTVTCAVVGAGSDGQPELIFSNNTKRQTF